MTRPPRPAPGRHRHAHRLRVAAVVVLAGYGAAFGASSAGHGFRLATHLLAEHRDAVETVLFGADEAHGEGHDERHGPEDVHEHDGRAHSHRDAPPATPLVTVALDLHCILPGALAPSPLPARSLDRVGPRAAAVPLSLPVEERPPQSRAWPV